MAKETIETTWEVWMYDVWGNAKDGYDVNDRNCVNRAYPMTLDVTVNSEGTKFEFKSASPSDTQIRAALDLTAIQLNLDGDDLNIYVNRARDGYPIGELVCTSHESLSPIRKIVEIRSGDTVQLRANPEGQHYRVDEFLMNKRIVSLSYVTDGGERVSGGTMDVSLLEPVPVG